MKRYMDTFFRYWLLIIIPIMVLPIGEYLLIRHPAPQIVAYANLYVTQPVSDGSYQFMSPAALEASNLNEWLQSSSFDTKVAMASPLYMKHLARTANPQAAAFDDLSKNMLVTAKGDHLVAISYPTLDAQQGLQVVKGLLATASTTTLSVSKWQQGIVGSYYMGKLRAAQQQEQQSAQQLADYISSHNIRPADFPVQLDSDPTFATLYNRNKSDQQIVGTLEQQVTANSGQAASPTTVAARQAYFVADQPTISVASSSKKKLLTYIAVALALGLLIGSVVTVLLTAMDKSLRYAGEVQALLGLPVVAIIAHSHALDVRDTHAEPKALPGHQPVHLEKTG